MLNSDIVKKNKTIIGDGVFVGSNSSLVAPIRIEKKTSKLNVNFKNHIQNIECSKHVFKM